MGRPLHEKSRCKACARGLRKFCKGLRNSGTALQIECDAGARLLQDQKIRPGGNWRVEAASAAAVWGISSRETTNEEGSLWGGRSW